MTVELVYRYCVECHEWRHFQVCSRGESTVTIVCPKCHRGRVVKIEDVRVFSLTVGSK